MGEKQRVRFTESIMGAGFGALACSESLPLHPHLPSNSSDLPSDAVKRLQFHAKAAEGTKGRAMVLKQVQTRQSAVHMQPNWLDALIASPPAVLAPLASAAVSTETMATSVPRRATSGRELEGRIERVVFG